MSYYASTRSIRQKAQKKASGASSLEGVKHGQGWAVGIHSPQVCSVFTLSARSTEHEGVAWGTPAAPGTLGRCPVHQPLATESCTRVTAGLSSPKQTPRLQEGAGLAAGQGGCSQQPPLLQGKKREI